MSEALFPCVSWIGGRLVRRRLRHVHPGESLISRKEYVAACVKLSVAQGQQFDKPAPPSPHSTGQTVSPENKGQQQPQGQTGPLETKSGGAPAESPQGQTPPGMQAAPDGSSKTIIDPDTKK